MNTELKANIALSKLNKHQRRIQALEAQITTQIQALIKIVPLQGQIRVLPNPPNPFPPRTRRFQHLFLRLHPLRNRCILSRPDMI